VLLISPQQRILLAVQPLDFRKGMDAIMAFCRQQLETDPMSGILFVFTNRRRTAIRTLCFDGQGVWLCQKRFSRGRLLWWPAESEGRQRELAARQLQILLWNGNPEKAVLAPLWRPLPAGPVIRSAALDNSRAAIARGPVGSRAGE
jgi:transposase